MCGYLPVKASMYTSHLQSIIDILLHKYNPIEFYILDNEPLCFTINIRKGVISMPDISIHFTETEYKLVQQHIENKGLTVSQYIKAMLLEEIEDDYDVSIANEYIQEKDTMEFLSFDDATKEWTL